MTTDTRRIVVGDWFGPLPKQQAFLSSSSTETVYAGGFGSGKTLVGGFKCLAAAMQHPGTTGLIARQTTRALRDTTQKVILDGDDKPPVIPPELIQSRSEKDNVTTVTLINGSMILFRSFQDWNLTKLRSLNLGWFYIDEATESPLALWLELLGRLRHPAGPGRCWATTNPNGHDWVWARFHPDSLDRDPDATLIHAPTEENTHLSPEYIHLLRRQPAEWVKRYVDASFDTAAGMIWDEWQRDIHVTAPVELHYNWHRFESLDHGRRNPTCYLQWAVDPEGFLVVENEYYKPGLVSEHAQAIAVMRGARRWGPVVSDPQVFTADAYGNTPAAEYAKHGIAMVAADQAVEAGLLRVSELLRRDPEREFPAWHPFAYTAGPDGRGAPALFVVDRCESLIREIPNYVWRELSPTMDDRQNAPEEPRKKNDHACDALRYGAMSQARLRPALDETVRRAASRRDDPDRHEVSAGILTRSF